MTIKDSAEGRMTQTAMRDLLRQIGRTADANHPARPNHPSNTRLNGSPRGEHDQVRVGGWVITTEPSSGDLVALDPDGNPHTLIARGGS